MKGVFHLMDAELEKKTSTKSEQVYNYLKDLILSGKLKPNERIIISKVAKDLDMSIIPVREALKKLATQGLVEFTSQKGARVAPMNIEEIEEIFMIRLELETFATGLAAENATEEEIEVLFDLCKEMDKKLKNQDVESYTLLNRKFHDTLYGYSRNKVLYEMIENLYARSENSKMIFNYDVQRMKDSNSEHFLIVESMAQRNKELAMDTMRKQKKEGFRIVLQALKLSQSLLEINSIK